MYTAGGGPFIYRAAAGDLGGDYSALFVQAEEKQRRSGCGASRQLAARSSKRLPVFKALPYLLFIDASTALLTAAGFC